MEHDEVDETDDSQSTPCARGMEAMVAQAQTHAHPRPSMGHRHKGSADSISYKMEEDSGEMKWIMERRRLAESGRVEILEREVVEGGRI
jgi:hypothetical protein